jgi:hypothetical protein
MPVKKKAKRATTKTAARSKPRLVKGLRITPAENGYIVYDSGRERVHYLNHTAGIVMDLCTGENAAAEIVSLVAAAYGLKKPPTREINALLQQLSAEGLVSLDS